MARRVAQPWLGLVVASSSSPAAKISTSGACLYRVPYCCSQCCAAGSDLSRSRLLAGCQKGCQIRLRRQAANQASLRKTRGDVELVVINVLVVTSESRDDHRRVSGLQRCHDRADTGVADDVVGCGHDIDHLLVSQELHPCGVWHRSIRRRAAVLDEYRFASTGEGSDQRQRAREGLLVGAQAKKDQTRFQT